MKSSYRVHRCNLTTAEVLVEVNGVAGKVPATVRCTEIELVPLDHSHGGITLRFIGQEGEEAATRFVEGAEISVPWDTIAPPAAPKGEAE